MGMRSNPTSAVAQLGARALGRLGLVGPAYAGYQRWQTWQSDRRRTATTAADGLPIPSQRLFVLIGGTITVASFLRKGEIAASLVRDCTEADGARLEELEDILDLGVGCGRVARHWKDLEGPRLHGCDINAELLEWVAENLPFIAVRRNEVVPPLPYADGSMDLVYGFSVLTHLPSDMQQPWLADLRRVLRPGGRLLVSTHGAAYAQKLTLQERAAFDAGRLVSRFEGLPGSNLCGAYHPEQAMQRLAEECGLQVRDFRPSGAVGNSLQDLWLLRRTDRYPRAAPAVPAPE